jgi:beta-lactamase class A
MHRRRLTRRAAVLSGLAAAACAPAPVAKVEPYDDRQLFFSGHAREIEARVGGRMGVAAWDTATNASLTHRAQERFAMCSMFKWLLAAQMLQMDEHAPGFRDQHVRFNAAYLANLGHTPATTANLARGWMTVAELAQAAVEQSDNGAANLLLEGAMGPEGFTRFLRASGDAVTRLDRTEMALNENLPGDERDTTTPDAMARTMIRVLTTDAVLNAASRETLTGWLIANQTGAARLRAGLPATWRAGDKTGTGGGEHNATTDVAIAWPPGRAPIVIACFLSESTVDADARNVAHADVARIVAQTWS